MRAEAAWWVNMEHAIIELLLLPQNDAACQSKARHIPLACVACHV